VRTLALAVLAIGVMQGGFNFVEVAKRVAPSVVTVNAATSAGVNSGSGFVVDASGTIVTNLHVVAGSTSVAIKLPTGDIYDQIRVRAFDTRKDLVVLQIPAFGLPTVGLGDSDKVQAGQPVALIGSPLGVLEGSVSTGVISGTRLIEDSGFRVIQTDAAANPGNSGGPLVDLESKVVGVLSFKLRGTEGLNFVVPINYVKGLLASTESFTLQELQARTVTERVDLFSASKPVFPSHWKSLLSGTTKILKVDGDYVYVDTVLPDAQRQAGGFMLSEFKKAERGYVGHTRSRLVCSSVGFFGERFNRCDEEVPIEITALSPTRIEGVAMVAPDNAKFDCGKCRWNQPLIRQPFTWIPQ